jgi:hypothetical protein
MTAETPPEPVATPAPPPPVTDTAPAQTASPTPPDPSRLDGLTPVEVIALMGEPGLVRRDGKVQVMLFEGGSCVYELVFIEPDPDAHFEVRHHSARTRRGEDTDAETCLSHILPDGTWPE